MYLLVFYIIWDAILNAIAELTRFSDREFYGPWWNSVTWDQFAREWVSLFIFFTLGVLLIPIEYSCTSLFAEACLP